MTSAHAQVNKTNGVLKSGLSIKSTPNPTRNQFALMIHSNSHELINLKVIDNAGRIIETRRNIAPGSTIYLGSRYHSGAYYVEVVQGSQRQTLLLVRQSH